MSLTCREFLQIAALTPLVTETLIMPVPETPADPPIRPGILLFLTDVHGQWASRCYGNRELQTPNMDYLAATEARMTAAAPPCPVCSPARACLFTGRLPPQHGIHDWIREEGDTRRWMERERPLSAPRWSLPGRTLRSARRPPRDDEPDLGPAADADGPPSARVWRITLHVTRCRNAPGAASWLFPFTLSTNPGAQNCSAPGRSPGSL